MTDFLKCISPFNLLAEMHLTASRKSCRMCNSKDLLTQVSKKEE